MLPGAWEGLQPVELLAVWDAQEWRRNRDTMRLATAIGWLRAMLDKDVDVEEIARSMGWSGDRGR